MTTIDRYLLRRIAGGLAVAAFVLLPLFSFLDLLEQLEDVGEGFYRARDAFLCTALLVPRRFVQLSPFIALLGNVIGLGRLAVNREITAMRAAGLSSARISAASLRAGLLLLLFVFVLDSTVAPDLQQKSLAHRSAALAQSTELGEALGIWTRDATRILRLGATPHARRAEQVEILRLGADGMLAEYIHAESAAIGTHDRWTLHDVTRKSLEADQVVSLHAESMPWQPFVRPDQISALNLPAESLSPPALYRYVKYLRATGQSAETYALAFWRRPGLALITIAMLLLSVPFALGSVRGGIGGRLILAAVTGIGVYLFDQITANTGLLLHLDPALVALVPGLLLVWAAAWLVRRAA
ncbi:MAG: LPS export ABC transporter permease LptG [Gammaproteobacteria bacterium]|nr:LPS export ABC transporter permease LptG [Gammaproteobacteria bacterium]